jgi:SSS family solute:Na+ symporter
MKRFCTVGWALTALIILAAMADNVELAADPDRVWGVAAREILGPFNLGLVGLMLACLVAALMSSADCYMLIVSGLIVRNGYAAYINPRASERTYVLAGRLAGAVVIVGGALLSLYYGDVFKQLKMAWELPIVFAAPFWVGMFWRRANRLAAWGTLLFSTLVFFVVPVALPKVMPLLAANQHYAVANDVVTTIVTRPAAPADVARREGAIRLWDQNVQEWTDRVGPQRQEAVTAQFGPRPQSLKLGQSIEDEFTTGGKPIYWQKPLMVTNGTNGKDDLEPVGPQHLVELERQEQGNTVVIRKRYRPECRFLGQGSFNLDFLLYDIVGVKLTKMDNAALETLRLPTRLVLPFVVMIVLSLLTPPNDRHALDRYYVKMKTPVNPNPAIDQAELEASYRDVSRFDDRRLFRRFGLEVQRPRLVDFIGCGAGFVICFAIIWFTVWLANVGG